VNVVASGTALLPIDLRKLPDEGAPGSGALWIRPAHSEDRERRATALLVYERGLDVLERGTGPVERLVVDAGGVQPTFDEMLAALLAQQLLTGAELPAGFGGLAEYARLIRQGLTPTTLPAEQTVEGIYQAVRNLGGGDLLAPRAAEAFLTRWQHLAVRLRKAAEAGEDVFNQSLFASGADFAEEKAYLRRDEEAYRQDVARGMRWKGRFPEGPPASSCLLLRAPKSLLFPFWSRRDRETPTGSPYLLLAVSWGKGEWVFSTDPVQKYTLKPLAELLQKAEASRDAQSAAKNPWFDGRGAFQHTLVAAPRGGTKLTDRDVLRCVQKWTRYESSRLRRWAPLLAGIAGLVLVGAFVGRSLSPSANPTTRPASAPSAEAEKHDHELSRLRINGQAPASPPERCRGMDASGEEVIFGVQQSISLQGQMDIAVEEENRFRQARPVKLRLLLRAEDNRTLSADQLLGVRINNQAIPCVARAKADGGVGAELRTVLQGQRNLIRVSLRNPGDRPVPSVLEVSWSDDPGAVTLHVLAVGVSRYKSKKVPQLQFADADAIQLTQALKASEGRLFKKVVDHSPLINDAADVNSILNALRSVEEQAQEHDLAVLIFSGHGKKFRNSDHYYFLPYQYDPDQELAATALAWDIMKHYLERMKCRVVLIMDTCHSGAAGLKGDRPKGDLDRAVAKALGEFSKAKRGILLLAACLGDQEAEEHPEWQHGALSLAILECLKGDMVAPAASSDGLSELPQKKRRAGVITLGDVATYAEQRVARLVKRESGQAVVVRTLNDITPQQIPLAVFGE
jgi:hypothetical protein